MTAEIYLILINLALFVLMGADKNAARMGAWRIPEKTLFLLAFLGGAPGGILGMYTFRHKTRHASFKYGFPAIAAVELALLFRLLGIA